MNIEVLRWGVWLIFAAGFYYSVFKQISKDLNGLGSRVGQDREKRDEIARRAKEQEWKRRLNDALLAMYLAPTKAEQQIILETLREKVHDA
jgi:hypothetical protein